MGSRRGLRILVGLLVVQTVAALGPVAPPSAAASKAPLLFGQLLDEADHPQRSVRVAAFVEPDARSVAALPVGAVSIVKPVGSAITSATGSFRMGVDDADLLRKAADSSGVVPVLLTAQTSAGQAYHRTRLQILDGGHVRAYGPDVDADADPEWRAALVRERRGNRQSFVIGTSMGVPRVRLVAQGGSGETGRSAPSRSSPNGALATYDPGALYCSGNPYGYRKTSVTSNRNTGLMRQYTMGRTTGEFDYAITSGTSLEVAVTSTAGTFSTAAGFARAASQSASVTLPTGVNSAKEWWVTYRFRAYDIICSNGVTTWASGFREWRPDLYTGSAGSRPWTVFTCNPAYRSFLGAGATVRVAYGRTATNTVAFAFGAGYLRTQQAWDTTESVLYRAVNVRTSYFLCGLNGYYTQSVSRTRETT